MHEIELKPIPDYLNPLSATCRPKLVGRIN